MKLEDQNNHLEDAQVAEALRHFRQSVHAWSDEEFSRPRVIQHARSARFWRFLASPILGWTFSAVVLATSVGVPAVVHRERVIEAQKQEALVKQQKHAAEEAERAKAAVIDDEALLSHVDSDISQAAPDAMEPLASLMSQTSE